MNSKLRKTIAIARRARRVNPNEVADAAIPLLPQQVPSLTFARNDLPSGPGLRASILPITVIVRAWINRNGLRGPFAAANPRGNQVP